MYFFLLRCDASQVIIVFEAGLVFQLQLVRNPAACQLLWLNEGLLFAVRTAAANLVEVHLLLLIHHQLAHTSHAIRVQRILRHSELGILLDVAVEWLFTKLSTTACASGVSVHVT